MFFGKSEKLPADNRLLFPGKTGGQLLNSGIVFGLERLVLHIVIAVEQTCGHEHAADRTAHLPQPSHPAAKGGGKTQGLLFLHAGDIAEGAEDGLRAVVSI